MLPARALAPSPTDQQQVVWFCSGASLFRLTLCSAPGTFTATPPAAAAACGAAALRCERLMRTEPTRMDVAPTHHCRLVASPNTALPSRPVALMLTALQKVPDEQAEQGPD